MLFNKAPFSPYSCNLYQSKLRFTLSKAFFKSMKHVNVSFFSNILFSHIRYNDNACSRQLCSFLKPSCYFFNILFSSNHVFNLKFKMLV